MSNHRIIRRAKVMHGVMWILELVAWLGFVPSIEDTVAILGGSDYQRACQKCSVFRDGAQARRDPLLVFLLLLWSFEHWPSFPRTGSSSGCAHRLIVRLLAARDFSAR
jgi:hypothetical protein